MLCAAAHTIPTVCCQCATVMACSMVEVQLAKLKEETRCPMCFGKTPL